MKIKDIIALLVLSALWGGSFLCIRIAAPVFGPIVLIELRVLIAGLALLLYASLTKSHLDLRKRWHHYLVIGIINSAIPFTLIATAELHLTAGLTATLNALTPSFGAIVAAIWLREALTLKKIIGLALGLVGVAVLVGWSQLPFTATIVFSVVASLAAAAIYGLAGVYAKVKVQGASSIAITTCSQLGASLFLLPLVPVALPQHAPTTPALFAVTILALLCTAVAYLLYFRLIENIGPTRTLTVTYLAPIFGVMWGILLLNETLTWSTVIGFAIILSGTGLVTGVRIRKAKSTARENVHDHGVDRATEIQ